MQIIFIYFCTNTIIISFQYTFDAAAKAIGVFVPIAEWVKLTNELRHNSTKKGNANASKVLAGNEKGMKEVRQIEKGKLKSIPLKQLLDAL